MMTLHLSEWIRHDVEEVTAILDRVDDASAESMVEAILGAERVFVVALGRSGMLARMFAMRLMQIGLAAHVAGDVTTPAIAAGDLLIAVSGSGRTETVVALARKAKGFGAGVLAITSSAARARRSGTSTGTSTSTSTTASARWSRATRIR